MMGRKQTILQKILQTPMVILRHFVRWWVHQDRKYRTKWRLANLLGVAVILSSVVIPVIPDSFANRHYHLSQDTLDLVGKNNDALASKLKYNPVDKRFEFNKESIKEFDPTTPVRQQIGGADEKTKLLYGLDVSTDPRQGVTFYDTNTQLSFKLVPQFNSLPGKTEQGRIVFPLDKGVQAVYTLKNNGLKEDIVVTNNKQATLSFTYAFELPKTLEARQLPDGSGGIGVYSADPVLFANMSYGSDQDRQALEKTRENSEKTHLVFGIPAPIITTLNGVDMGNASARFELRGDKLTIVAERLTDIKGTFSIDPSVVVTNTADFMDGNNEGNIDFGTNQISRGALTGGTIGSWGNATANTFVTRRTNFASATYNGFIYILGGQAPSGTGGLSSVEYAKIEANGTLSSNTCGTSTTWCSDGSITATWHNQAVAYNGYLYSLPGQINALDVGNTVQKARICDGIITTDGCSAGSNNIGKPGTWVNANTGASYTARMGHASVAYGGYIYVLGGCSDIRSPINTPLNCDVIEATNYKAEVNPDGTLGAWTSITALPDTRYNHGAVAYNGYIYVVGGCNAKGAGLLNGNCIGYSNTILANKIKSDGTIGSSWINLGVFGTARSSPTPVVYNGYMYIIGGCGSGDNAACTVTSATVLSDVRYAPIYANGTLGSWSATNDFGAPRAGHESIAYQGYIFTFGGCDASSNCAQTDDGTTKGNTFSGTIDPPGGTPATVTNGGTGAVNSFGSTNTITARSQAATVAYNGYLYVTGGCTAAGATMNACNDSTNATQFTKLAAANNGTVDGYSTLTTGFTNSRFGHATVAYNGYLYIIGGCTANGTWCSATPTTDIRYVALDPNTGQMTGGWQPATGPARYGASATVYNGYLYLVGGCSTANCSTIENTVQRAQINPDGSLGTWSSTGAAFSNSRFFGNTVAYAGKLYVMGGCAAVSSGDCSSILNSYQYATINSDGSLAGSWSTATSFGTGRYGASLSATNGMMYLIGGCTANSSGNCTNLLSAVRSTYINADGTLGSWSDQANSLGTARYLHGSAITEGYLYVIGGRGGAGLLDDTQYAGLQLIARIGRYSKLVDLAKENVKLTDIEYNGALSDRRTNITYRTAQTGGTFSSLTNVPALPLIPCGAGTATSTRYVFVTFIFDDSYGGATGGTFGETNTAGVTDFTIRYGYLRPPPNIRLRLGQTLQQGELSAYDTCHNTTIN